MNGADMPGEVRRLDEELGLVAWPEPARVGHLAIGRRECFVTAMGFEERAIGGLARACGASGGFHVALVRYLPRVVQNREDEFRKMAEANELRIVEFDYDRERPAGMGLRLAEYAARFERVYLDISGMSRLLIVQAVAALAESRIECILLYSEAKVYPPLRSEYEMSRGVGLAPPSFISSGVFEVVSTPELSSVAMLGSAIRLIAFLSFDSAQLSNLVQEIQPTHVDIVRGRSPHEEMAWRTDAVGEINKKAVTLQRNVEEHEASTFDYTGTMRMVLALYGRHAAFNRIVVAPTGSKMQAVGIGIIRGVLGDVQVVYPTPREFLEPERYTEGIGDVFSISFRWGRLLP